MYVGKLTQVGNALGISVSSPKRPRAQSRRKIEMSEPLTGKVSKTHWKHLHKQECDQGLLEVRISIIHNMLHRMHIHTLPIYRIN